MTMDVRKADEAVDATTTFFPDSETLQRIVDIAKQGQVFAVSHLGGESDFGPGFRGYATYRDLGFAAATNGLLSVNIVRPIAPCPDGARSRHYHDDFLHFCYVLRGWQKMWFEGQGEITFRAGSAWIQPPKISHRVLDYSDDSETLELILPVEYGTFTQEL
jgi:uncharacterized RmlC-like cupin family protein